ncbi:hypothetical protein AAG906_007685 [Vitis piasezkii]
MILVYVQTTPTIAESHVCNVGPKEYDWAVDIRAYLQTGALPEDPKHAHKVRVQASRFTLIGNDLYRRSLEVREPRRTGAFIRILLAHHEAGREIYVRKCNKCQKHASIPHVPAETLNSITSPWPSRSGDGYHGTLTHYRLEEWVEAEAYASIKDKDIKRFVWKNIVCRFGIPQAIIADNGPQFDSSAFKGFCTELHIKNLYSTPRYPQSNGQAEATNKTLLSALKKRLEKAKGKWVEELPDVLWAYRTTPGRPTGNTPFALAYGTDAVIPTEVGMPTARTAVQGQRNEDDELARHLDWADEAREAASIRMAAYQQKVAAYYNRKVRPRIFKEGSLVLRKIFENTAEKGAEKFQANWEGPYVVSKANENGSYHLQTLNGTPLLRPWNGRIALRVPPSSDISHPNYIDRRVPPSPDISHPELAGWERRRFNFPIRHVRILDNAYRRAS